MTDYLARMKWADAAHEQPISPLLYPFLWTTFFYGVGFVLFSWWAGVQSSSLWQAFHEMSPYAPHVWGLAALGASIFAAVLLLFRIAFFGKWASMFGFCVWLFAAITYAENNFWLPFATVTLPNMFFWTWYYFRVKRYERDIKSGRIVDPA